MDRLTAWKKSSFCADRHCVEVQFVKSSACTSGTCVEVGHDADGVQMRDGKDPAGPVLRFTAEEWKAFIAGAKAGEFD